MIAASNVVATISVVLISIAYFLGESEVVILAGMLAIINLLNIGNNIKGGRS